MQRKHFVAGLVVALLLSSIVIIKILSLREFQLPVVAAEPAGETSIVYMANGMKIGEVTSDSAIIWTRLTRNPASDPDTRWGRVVTGKPGEVRILYWPSENRGLQKETSWLAVETDEDFTRQFHLAELLPATNYTVLVEGRSNGNADDVSRLEGRFSTAPGKEDTARILFSVVTGQGYHRRDDEINGHTIYQSLVSLDVDFFVHTGDNVYYDKPGPLGTSPALARFKWNRMYALPFQRSFFNRFPSYFMKDDHDTLKNDSSPGEISGNLTWEQGLAIFREQVPMGEKTYRTFRWGRDLQIWLVEGRDFRSSNSMADGPDKTIWGDIQKKWVFDSVQISDATFRILITPTPIVGPDHSHKNDNHANVGFKTEGDEIRSFVGKQENMFVITGDRHWQYISEDPKTGVIEFGTGPTTDEHAGGFKKRNRSPMQKYLKIKGGYLSVEVVRSGDEPQIIFRHHAVDGSVYNEKTFSHSGTEIDHVTDNSEYGNAQ